MKEIVVLSGKGGTGKTTILAAFASLAGKSVIVDTDVDAPNLFMILSPEVIEEGDFSSSKKAVIDGDKCINCGDCIEYCRFDAIKSVGNEVLTNVAIDEYSCEGCGLCYRICPHSAISMVDHISGKWYISETRFGPMVHALLEPGDESSGKLVTLVKQYAGKIAKDREIDTILVDGPPGIGCPVIASIAGADLAVLIAEPSKSCISDLTRMIDLANSFNITPVVILNRYDLSYSISKKLEEKINSMGIRVIGRIPFDEGVFHSLSMRKTVIEDGDSRAGKAIEDSWNELRDSCV